MPPRELNAQEVVRWLNDLERRHKRLRRITAVTAIVALAALLLPVLPIRLPMTKPWIEVFEVASPELIHTGRFRMSVHEGDDPRVSLISTNLHSHANLAITKGSPEMVLYDEEKNRVRLSLPQRTRWGEEEEASVAADEATFYGLESLGDCGQSLLGGEEGALIMEMSSPRDGAVRMWAGRRTDIDRSSHKPEPGEKHREPGSALVLVDAAGQPRIDLRLTEPAASTTVGEERLPPESPVPALTLRDAEGHERIILKLAPVARKEGDETGATAVPVLVLIDHLRRERAILALDESGAPVLRFLGPDGRVVWTAP